jgi:transcriptional regulator GlxA family with amidase domain
MPTALIARSADALLHPSVRRARDYLESHRGPRVSLDELARAAFMSKYHLVRRFKAAVGVTPGQYQVLIRLARARTFLEQGLPVAWVAYETGFADQSHLTRAFRDAYGVTPARFAALAASGEGGAPRPVRDGEAPAPAAHLHGAEAEIPRLAAVA